MHGFQGGWDYEKQGTDNIDSLQRLYLVCRSGRISRSGGVSQTASGTFRGCFSKARREVWYLPQGHILPGTAGAHQCRGLLPQSPAAGIKEKARKPKGFRALNVRKCNRLSLGELGSATCGLQTVLGRNRRRFPLQRNNFSYFD